MVKWLHLELLNQDVGIKFDIKVIPDKNIRDDIEVYYYEPTQYKSFEQFNQHICIKNKTDRDIGFNIELKGSKRKYKKIIKFYENESYHYTVEA